MFGEAGAAQATGFKETGLAEWIGGRLTVLDGFNFVVIVVISAALVLFCGDYINTATATMIITVLASLALALNVHPYALMVPAAMASKVFPPLRVPVGTPPMQLFSHQQVKYGGMVRTGFVIFTLIFLIVGAVFYILPFWGVDLAAFPDNLKSN